MSNARQDAASPSDPSAGRTHSVLDLVQRLLEMPADSDWTPSVFLAGLVPIYERAALVLAALGVAQLASGADGASPMSLWLHQSQLQLRLEETAQLVSRLTHDFNNVLTGILGFTELSQSQAPAGSLLATYLKEV